MLRSAWLALICGFALFTACSSADEAPSQPSGGSSGSGGSVGTSGGSGGSYDGGGVIPEGGGATGGSLPITDPKTCADTQFSKTYVGCDFWPTVVANSVWSIFDFAVVVANTGDAAADITIDRAGVVVRQGQVAPGGLTKFYLPWILALKGEDSDTCANPVPLTKSVREPGGAYHLVSSVPVAVYQFNAIEYQGSGGPAGKNWATCPGSQICSSSTSVGCYSFSNDASLLLPSTSLTGSYWVTGMKGWLPGGMPPYIAITGIEKQTTVQMRLGAKAQVTSGGGITAASAGQVISFPLARGEVVEIVATPSTDLSGSLIVADKTVQVIAGVQCIRQPFDKAACDHVEESVFPAETMGRRYFVTVPTSPNGDVIGHGVRLYGAIDNTQLDYPAGAPAAAPQVINAGQVVDLGIVDKDFEVSGDNEFAVASFMLGGSLVDPQPTPGNEKGDPAQSLAVAVEQYRKRYVFLAPDDYDVSFADVVMPEGTQLTMDGAPVTEPPTPISSGFVVVRIPLGPGVDGAHVLTATEEVGLQVMGYGTYTSYHYPGGLNLAAIAPPPIIK